MLKAEFTLIYKVKPGCARVWDEAANRPGGWSYSPFLWRAFWTAIERFLDGPGGWITEEEEYEAKPPHDDVPDDGEPYVPPTRWTKRRA